MPHNYTIFDTSLLCDISLFTWLFFGSVSACSGRNWPRPDSVDYFLFYYSPEVKYVLLCISCLLVSCHHLGHDTEKFHSFNCCAAAVPPSRIFDHLCWRRDATFPFKCSLSRKFNRVFPFPCDVFLEDCNMLLWFLFVCLPPWGTKVSAFLCISNLKISRFSYIFLWSCIHNPGVFGKFFN